MMTEGSPFLMDTKGHCLLCLKLPKSREDDPLEVGAEIFSLRKVCQYLKLNMRNVFAGRGVGTDNPSYLSALERSELKGVLCEECGRLAETIVDISQEMEVLQKRLESCLRVMHDKVKAVEENKEEVEEYTREIMGSPQALLHYGIRERLRKETLEKASLLIRKTEPQIRIIVKEMDTSEPHPPSPEIKEEEQSRSDNGDDNDPDWIPMDSTELPDSPMMSPSTSTATATTVGGNINPFGPGILYPVVLVMNDGRGTKLAKESETSRSHIAIAPKPSTEKDSHDHVPPSPSVLTRKRSKPKIEPDPDQVIIKSRKKSKRLILYQCDLCDETFNCRAQRLAHKKIVHLGIINKCHICGAELKYVFSLRQHISKMHPGAEATSSQTENSFSGPGRAPKPHAAAAAATSEPHQPSEGNKLQIGNSERIEVEIRKGEESQFIPEEDEPQPTILRYGCRRPDLNPLEPQICEYCGDEFKGKRSLARHRNLSHREHNDEKQSFQCEACGAKFSQSCSLKRHMRDTCGGRNEESVPTSSSKLK